MDFFHVAVKEHEKGDKQGLSDIYPDFIVGRSQDLMVRAKTFYAIYDEATGLWSTDEYEVRRLVDEELARYADEHKGQINKIRFMRNFSSNSWRLWRNFLSSIGDNNHTLDSTITFADTVVKKEDYVSRRLSYSLKAGDHAAWDELIGTLYLPEERAKLEWAIGAIISGDSKKIQKFLVLHGPPGAGKGTVIDIILELFEGYTTTFEAKALASNSSAFAMETFRHNPIVAIQHDGDLSRIEDNTKINSIVSHEPMTMNEKHKPAYTIQLNAFLIMGTNKPVKITDAQSGLLRRLIDVYPSGVRVEEGRYHVLRERIKFELGAIAHHCLQTYKKMGRDYYSAYRPVEMMFQTDTFFNFIDVNSDLFELQDGATLKQAWDLYKEYCNESGIDKGALQMHKVQAELKNYFHEFHERYEADGKIQRKYYKGFKELKRKFVSQSSAPKTDPLVLECSTSLLDDILAQQPAQYVKDDGSPMQRWDRVTTTLADIDTTLEHYVKVPENLIVIDFDLKDETGGKSLERNLDAASRWPVTYAELSKSGAGVHLHYYWTGEVPLAQLSQDYADGIEVKRYPGRAALRRRVTRCGDAPIAELSTGLPLKEKKSVLEQDQIQNEKTLRALVLRTLRKEIHPGTKPSIDFLRMVMDREYRRKAYSFDLSDLRPAAWAFANSSSNHAQYCLEQVLQIHFKSDNEQDGVVTPRDPAPAKDDRLVIYDIEIYPNLFVVAWKFRGAPDESAIALINPTAQQVEELMQFKLVGFNNRKYDNHILWGAYLGFNNQQLYNLSRKMIKEDANGFGEAYNLSWTDIWDFASEKKSLKKWQVELGLKHKEMDLDWDSPAPEDRWMEIAEYCVNDVISTEKVLDARDGDYKARLILADLSGLTPNDTTARHTAQIVFKGHSNPQRKFVYTKLANEFPGYQYIIEAGKPPRSEYRGEIVGEGGYVYAEPGIYENVALLDIASMHPTSIGYLNAFGDYTPNFMAIVEAQLALKHKDYKKTKELLDGKLAPYVEEIEQLGVESEAADKATKSLRYALKIAVNIVYGLTSAKFNNPFKDPRNVDNIVAKRGALFMIELKHYIQELGYTVAHIKTDSVKIPNADDMIIEEIMRFGEKYGYKFEHEHTYSKLALFNDAVYVAKEDDCNSNCWTATGTQFHPDNNPYTFKSLFNKDDDITFRDLCVAKSVVKGSIWMDFDNDMGLVLKPDKELKANPELLEMKYASALNKLHFVGRTGLFVPVKAESSAGDPVGATLYRVLDGKAYAVAGTKDYRWMEADNVRESPHLIDYQYFEDQLEEARQAIEKLLPGTKFKTVEEFVS